MTSNKITLENHEEEFLQDPKRKIKKGLFWFIGLMFLAGSVLWAVDLITTPVQSARDIIKKTLSSDNVIENYEWYKQQYNDYLAIEIKISEADTAVIRFIHDTGMRSGWSFEDKEEYSRLSGILQGLRYQKAEIASKYNERSKMLNRELFETSDLPEELH